MNILRRSRQQPSGRLALGSMDGIHLIHPLYLDVPMLISFAAAVQGGLSLSADVTLQHEAKRSASATGQAKFGLTSLFSTFIDVAAQADISGASDDMRQETRRESRSHTAASIAILLCDALRKNPQKLIRPTDAKALSTILPGSLVEVAGILEKNAVDTVIDQLLAISIMTRLAEQPEVPPSQKGRQAAARPQPPKPADQFQHYHDVLDEDRQRTPTSNAILRCDQPPGINCIITLRRDNLRDLTLTELNKNRVTVVGKVTRTVPDGQSIIPFENYAMGLFSPEFLRKTFDGLNTTGDIILAFSDVEIRGPAVQILPLIIYV